MADMSLNELKEYVQMVYSQEILYNLQLQKIKEISAIKSYTNPPVEPVLEAKTVFSDEEDNRVKNNRSGLFTAGGAGIGFLVAAITGFDHPEWISDDIFWPLYLIACAFAGWIINRVMFKQADKKKAAASYSAYEKGNNAINSRNEAAKQNYLNAYMVYNAKLNQIAQMEKVENARAREVKTVLDAIYGENIIYPDYRNIVAMSFVNQFLQAGRGTTLGEAYNQFAIENKLDQINGSLNSIEGKLDIIIEQLQNINSSMTYGFREISNQAKAFAGQMNSHLNTIANNQSKIAENQNTIIANQALEQDSLKTIAENTKVLSYIRNTRHRYIDMSYFADDYNKFYN